MLAVSFLRVCGGWQPPIGSGLDVLKLHRAESRHRSIGLECDRDGVAAAPMHRQDIALERHDVAADSLDFGLLREGRAIECGEKNKQLLIDRLAAMSAGTRAIVSICADGGQGSVVLLQN